MVMIDANTARSGTKIMLDGELYNVVEKSHHKPGKGGAFVRFKLKGVVSGKVIDHTVRAGTKLEQADVTVEPMQYLYQDAESYIFMNLSTYEQIKIDAELIGFASNFLKEATEVEVTLHEGNPIGVQLPQKMVFEVVDTIENPAKGNTATNITKDATLETGLVIQVPLFVKLGDKVKILTEDGSYLERM